MYCSEKISQTSGEKMSGEQMSGEQMSCEQMSGEQMSCEHLSHWAIVGEQISQWANVAWAIVLWAFGVWNFDRDVSKYEGEQMSEWAIVGLRKEDGTNLDWNWWKLYKWSHFKVACFILAHPVDRPNGVFTLWGTRSNDLGVSVCMNSSLVE